jgi:OPT oligopeptide transporter protein
MGDRVTIAKGDEVQNLADESLDKAEITVTEKPRDVENDSVTESKQQQSEFIEVRAAVDLGDDETMPAETFRAYTIGLTFTLLGSVVSNLTHLRSEPLTVDPVIVQLISYPIGRFWARYVPKWTVPLGKFSFQLNPGPFTIKEHTLITVMANVGMQPPYAVGIIVVQVVKFRTILSIQC